MPEQILLDQILYNTFLVVSMTMLFCAGAQILCVLEGYKIKPFEQRPWFQRLAKSSQSNQPKKGKGIILRDVATVIIIVSTLLLSADQAFARDVTFYWGHPYPEEEQIGGYRLYYDCGPSEAIEGPSPVVIMGGMTMTASLTGLDATYGCEFTLTAWRDEWNGSPTEFIESAPAGPITLPALSDLPPLSPLSGFHIIEVR